MNITTVRVRKDWIEQAIEREGGMIHLAEKLQCSTSVISRSANGLCEAGPRFVGAVLKTFPVKFEQAFDVVEERAVPRRKRTSQRKAQAA